MVLPFKFLFLKSLFRLLRLRRLFLPSLTVVVLRMRLLLLRRSCCRLRRSVLLCRRRLLLLLWLQRISPGGSSPVLGGVHQGFWCRGAGFFQCECDVSIMLLW